MTTNPTPTDAAIAREAFKRENRYIVFKRKDCELCMTDEQRSQLIELARVFWAYREAAGKSDFDCVVVERDWPEYEPTWKAIEARVAGANHPAQEAKARTPASIYRAQDDIMPSPEVRCLLGLLCRCRPPAVPRRVDCSRRFRSLCWSSVVDTWPALPDFTGRGRSGGGGGEGDFKRAYRRSPTTGSWFYRRAGNNHSVFCRHHPPPLRRLRPRVGTGRSKVAWRRSSGRSIALDKMARGTAVVSGTGRICRTIRATRRMAPCLGSGSKQPPCRPRPRDGGAGQL